MPPTGVEKPLLSGILACRDRGDDCDGLVLAATALRDGDVATDSIMFGDGVRGGVGVGGTISAGFVHCVLPDIVLW